ncbi:AAA ATPase [Myotisia sp. PD_48]|nr:AAA ATPase [Myotisia sp. PD_48]
MSPSILGKRQSNALESPASASQSKRPSRSCRILDDSEDPFISSTNQRTLRSRTRNGPKIQPGNANSPSRNIQSSSFSLNSELDLPIQPIVENVHVNDENSPPTEFTTPRKKQKFTDVLTDPIPVTPRHRVQIGAKPLTPRTPRTLPSPTTTPSIYASARQLFTRSAKPNQLVGRENEKRELELFIDNSLSSKNGGCMYVSGPPGTGKTALIDELCLRLEDSCRAMKIAKVNCASLTNCRDIWGCLLAGLGETSSMFKKSEEDRLSSLFLPKKPSSTLYLVVLDEIDHLLNGNTEILYKLFEWALQPMSRLLLIGIANALDLTDRLLPCLKSKDLKPHLLPFLPYTPTQIADVITTRLRSLLPDEDASSQAYVPFLHPAAIQLCSRKVASQSGDLRKGFDIVCRTLDLLEREARQKENTLSKSAPLLENNNLSTPAASRAQRVEYDARTAPRATIAHVARVTSTTFSNGTSERLHGLNLQQKAALCALISFGRNQRNPNAVLNTPPRTPQKSAPSVRELFETYSGLCRRDKILHPLTATEFKDVISSLETLGLLGEVDTPRRGLSSTPSRGSELFSTPSKSGRGRSRNSRKSVHQVDSGLVCYVGAKEVEGQVSGPGEGILRALLTSEGY